MRRHHHAVIAVATLAAAGITAAGAPVSDRRVLVVGGSGVLGRALVPLLTAGGNAVTVLARSDAAAAGAAAAGAVTRRGDIFDPASLREAARGQDVIVHLATRIPRSFPGRPEEFAENDRIRREGTANLVAAAESAGVARLVLQSIIWVHGDHGDNWIDEDSAVQPGRLTASALDLEDRGRDWARRVGGSAIILRCGGLYAGDAWHTGETIRRLRARSLPIVAGGRNYQGFVHAADAAAAFAAGARSDAPSGTFLVTDDEPVRMAEYLDWLARAAGAPAPLHLPGFMARLALGGEMVAALGASVRCRNDRMKAAFGWTPRYPSYRDGYGEMLSRGAEGAGG